MINRQYFHLLAAFFRREWLVRYGSGGLGLLILLANPAAFIGLKWLSQSTGWTIMQFSHFLFGLMWWLLLSSTVANAAAVASSYSALVRKAAFPRSILVLLPILLALTDFLLGLILYSVSLLFSKLPISDVLFIPLILMTLLPFLVGISGLLITLIFRFRKFRYAIPMVILVAFITTPFVFEQDFTHINLVQGRNPFYFALRFASQTYSISYLALAFLMGLFYFISGIALFRKAAGTLADF